MEMKIEYIDIEKLVVDGTNVRESAWDADPEFIEDVKTHEIRNPLRVRPLNDGRFGVVAGSRRYNASIDAGLEKCPCVVEDLDDLHAIAVSISENAYTKGVEDWMYQKKVGQMAELIRPTLAPLRGINSREGLKVIRMNK
jgi:ParB family chromosome partitioning protein